MGAWVWLAVDAFGEVLRDAAGLTAVQFAQVAGEPVGVDDPPVGPSGSLTSRKRPEVTQRVDLVAAGAHIFEGSVAQVEMSSRSSRWVSRAWRA